MFNNVLKQQDQEQTNYIWSVKVTVFSVIKARLTDKVQCRRTGTVIILELELMGGKNEWNGAHFPSCFNGGHAQ